MKNGGQTGNIGDDRRKTNGGTDYETDAVSHYIVFLGVLSGILDPLYRWEGRPVMAVLLLVYLAAAYWINRISRIEI